MVNKPPAREYKVTVPTKHVAEDVALALAHRGHRLVAVREVVGHPKKGPKSKQCKESPDTSEPEGLWAVFSLVVDPEPDKDHEWWAAMEEKALRDLARCHGGEASCWKIHFSNTTMSVQKFNRDGLLYRVDAKTASTRRLEVLTSYPARASERVPFKQDVDEDLPDGPGQPITLQGVEDVDWSTLDHAYGKATDIPRILYTLASNDERWNEANEQLCSSVTHQESIYSATAPTMRFIASIASAPQLLGKRRLDLLYTLFIAGCQQDVADFWDYELRYAGPVGPEVRDAVVSQVNVLLPLWPSVSRAEQRLLLLLTALVPEGVSIKQSAHQAIGESDLNDPASRLAQALIQNSDSAEACLIELARTYEELIPLTEGDDAPQRARIITAIHKTLF